MAVDLAADFGARVKRALDDEGLRIALERATGRLKGQRAQAFDAIDAQRLRADARAVRESAVADLPDLLGQLEGSLTANGCQVHWARDAAEAQETVIAIAQRHAVRRVVKSKSMVAEEIKLTDALQQSGIDVFETDLGEYIIQLADEPPSHIIAPVIHKRAEDISELFQRELGMPATDDPAEMCAAARSALREEFLRADMGISGCNFAIAETGTICVVTNEGNGRMVTSMPPVYVAVAGIEKVVPKVEDAFLLWQAASRSATGQDVSVYFSLSSGPRRPGQPDGPEEMHVVLLDNGRSRILERGYPQALLCIRCGACLNACPVYREIGGHAYGDTPYNGPIGAVLTPLLADDITSARELPFASSLCGACRDVCPVKIDLPRLLLDLRSELTQRRASSTAGRLLARGLSLISRSQKRFERFSRLARLAARLKLSLPLAAWTRTRDFPRFAERSFRQLWRERLRARPDGANRTDG